MTLQQAMRQSEFNSAEWAEGSDALVVDGRCAADGDFWTIRSGRTTNRHYGSLEALVEAEASTNRYRSGWEPYTFY